MPKLKYSLLSLATVTTAMAALFGLHAYVYESTGWTDILDHFIVLAAGVGWSCLAWWLIAAAPWSIRVLAAGFVVGAVFEVGALALWSEHQLMCFAPGSWAPEGWYPLSFPVARLLVTSGMYSVEDAPLPAIFMGALVSGAITGSGLIMIWCFVVRHRTPG